MMNNLDIFPDIPEKLWNLKKIISKSTKEVPISLYLKKKELFPKLFSETIDKYVKVATWLKCGLVLWSLQSTSWSSNFIQQIPIFCL